MTTALAAAFAATLAALVASSSVTPASDADKAIRTETAQSTPVPRRPTVCTEQYAPVCARIGGALRTFSNACFARAEGAEIVAEGPCKG